MSGVPVPCHPIPVPCHPIPVGPVTLYLYPVTLPVGPVTIKTCQNTGCEHGEVRRNLAMWMITLRVFVPRGYSECTVSEDIVSEDTVSTYRPTNRRHKTTQYAGMSHIRAVFSAL